MPTEKAFALKCGNVLHYRCLTGEPKMFLNLACARRDSFFPLLALDEIENVFLTMRQHALCSSNPSTAQVQMNRCSLLNLNSETFAARAMRDGIRIGDFETAFLQVIAVVEHRTADEKRTLWVDNHAHVRGLN